MTAAAEEELQSSPDTTNPFIAKKCSLYQKFFIIGLALKATYEGLKKVQNRCFILKNDAYCAYWQKSAIDVCFRSADPILALSRFVKLLM